MVSPTLMLLCLGKHRHPQVPTLRVQIPFPVVEMVGFEPTMEAELTNGVIRFALSLRHISMYCRLSRCVKTRLIFTVFARGFNPLQTLPHGGSQIPHTFCRRSQPPPQGYSMLRHCKLVYIAFYRHPLLASGGSKKIFRKLFYLINQYTNH